MQCWHSSNAYRLLSVQQPSANYEYKEIEHTESGEAVSESNQYPASHFLTWRDFLKLARPFVFGWTIWVRHGPENTSGQAGVSMIASSGGPSVCPRKVMRA